jgi:hypothetical protein
MNNKQRLIEHLRYRIIEKLNEDNEEGNYHKFSLVHDGDPHPMALYPGGDDLLNDQVRTVAEQLEYLHNNGHIRSIDIETYGKNGEVITQTIPGHDLQVIEENIHPDSIHSLLLRERTGGRAGKSASRLKGFHVNVSRGEILPHGEPLEEPVDLENVSRGDADPQKTHPGEHNGAIAGAGLEVLHPEYVPEPPPYGDRHLYGYE